MKQPLELDRGIVDRPASPEYSISRRTAIRAGATGLGLLSLGGLGSGVAAAHGGPRPRASESACIGDGTAWTYIERARGQLSAVGVRFDAEVLTGLPSDPAPVDYDLALPVGETGPFEYVGIDWNSAGHDPLPLYGFPHFDFHFYMLDEATVAEIPAGTPAYDIPEELMPANTYTTADLPPQIGPSPRAVVPAMGEHLVSVPASVPQNPGSDGWSVFIWGAYDPDGDGTGQLTFMEPMITVAYLQDLMGCGESDAEESAAIPMPERFLTGGWYPTEFVVAYDSDDDTFSVSLESFEQLPGYGRRG